MAGNNINVIFVCLGNICRSPLAEAIFSQKVERMALGNKIKVRSAGTAHWHIGDPPDPRTLEIAGDHHVPIEHRAHQLKPAEYSGFEYIIAMDRDNRKEILKNFENDSKTRVFMMREFDNLKSGKDVPDPYYGGKEEFEMVFNILDESCDNFLEFLLKEHHL